MLDFAALAAQMEAALDAETWRPSLLLRALEAAQELCTACGRRGDFNALLSSAAQKESIPESWHPARLLDDSSAPNAAYAAVAPPLPHVVVAADGSQIYPDSHEIADCYLLNISGIALRYGDTLTSTPLQDNALMQAVPQFFSAASEDDWHGGATRQNGTRDAGSVNREMVDARRHIAELDELARLLESVSPNIDAIGLCDGIFDLRVAATQSWRNHALAENNRALDALRQCGHPVGGYIAASRATDVVIALRVVLNELADGDNPSDETDAALSRLTDVRLFDALLQSGERCATFVSGRSFSGTRYMASTRDDSDAATSRHATCFFYLKIDEGNVARVEFPRWVAETPGWLDRLHLLLASQIEKGGGYPVALMEAHEQAVVRAVERDLFYQLLEERMTARGWQPRRSAKNLSKSRPLV
ncbi:MAG TPA: DNA double-strand break repair nuclease NurA [Abditibacteriaceae bacterium]|jgi:hypothetical protein